MRDYLDWIEDIAGPVRWSQVALVDLLTASALKMQAIAAKLRCEATVSRQSVS